MTLSTQQARNVWGPPCSGRSARVRLYGAGSVVVRTSIVDAVLALNACLAHFYYSTRAADTGGYVCRAITGGSKYSLHAYKIAIDINWQSNPYGSRLRTNMPRAMVAAILAIRTNNGRQVWVWGGDFRGNKDAMHFQIACSPQDLATGINWASVPGVSHAPKQDPKPTPKPKPKPQETDVTRIVKVKESGTLWVVNGVGRRNVSTEDAQLLALAGYAVYGPGGVPFVHPRATVELVPIVDD